MKWLILSDEAYLHGGLQSRVRELASVALCRDHTVNLVCLRKNPYESLADTHPSNCRVEVVERVEPRSLQPTSLTSAWRLIRQVKPDVLFFCTTGVPNFFPHLVVARLLGVKHRIVHFGTMAADASNGFGVEALGRELITSAKIAYRNMTLGLFNNEPQMASWRAEYGWSPNGCRIWNCPIDLDRFGPNLHARRRIRADLGIEECDFVIGGVGALNSQKSFDLAARAIGIAAASIPTIRLVIAGDGDRDTVMRAAAKAGVVDRVLLLGDRSDIPDLMNAFDVFCMPSADPNETLGIVFVEAQACGVPIVVPDLPGPRRVALDGRAGMMFDVGDIRAIADAWTQLYEHPELRHKLRQAGLANAEDFDRTVVFDGLLKQMGSRRHSSTINSCL